MGLKAKFKISQFESIYKQAAIDHEKACIDKFIKVGQVCIDSAIKNGDYRNITGNLRDSIGFMVTKDSYSVHENFGQAGTGVEGSVKAIVVAEELAQKYKKGIALIVVAGEHYALFVEAKGRNVLTASGISAKNELLAAFKSV